jgi:hypothetical protein
VIVQVRGGVYCEPDDFDPDYDIEYIHLECEVKQVVHDELHLKATQAGSQTP